MTLSKTLSGKPLRQRIKVHKAIKAAMGEAFMQEVMYL